MPNDVEAKGEVSGPVTVAASRSDDTESNPSTYVPEQRQKSLIGPKPDAAWYTSAGLWWWIKFCIFRGVDQDVVGMQNRRDKLSGDLEETHAHAAHYDNKAEYMYSFLQVMTAATASFVHGANDISVGGPVALSPGYLVSSVFFFFNPGS